MEESAFQCTNMTITSATVPRDLRERNVKKVSWQLLASISKPVKTSNTIQVKAIFGSCEAT